jgi:uncharacterized protein YcbX
MLITIQRTLQADRFYIVLPAMVSITFNPFASPGTVSEIVELRIYPIKSCRGIKVDRTTLTRQGLDLDRRWMFVDEKKHEFITIRQKSQMTLINTAISADGQELTISIRDTDKSVKVPARPAAQWLEANTKIQQVEIWGHETDGYEYSDEINSVFTDFFGEEVSLIYKGPTQRVCQGNGAAKFLGREESVNFPDVLPVLIASQSSLQELNLRLTGKGEDAITVERFRPNIIIKGDVPWSEDSWKTVRINGSPSLLGSFTGGNRDALDIDVAARCARCQVPNVNPDTAVKHKKEPWDTLMSYRRVDKGMKYKPCFGMLCCPRNEGEIAVGMRFEVLEMTDKHFYQVGF